MRAAALAYFVSYFLFSSLTKSIGHHVAAAPLVLASTLACCAVAALAFALEHLAASLDHVPSAFSRTWQRLGEGDVVVAATGSAAVLLASTLAYSQHDVSLLLPLLLMKGGVLLWGPVVDWLRGESSSRRSRLVLVLAASAVVLVLWQKFSLSSLGVGVAMVCALVYVAAYFPKIAVMARHRGDFYFLLAEMTLTLAIALPGAAVLALVDALRHAQGLGDSVALGAACSALYAQLGPLLRTPLLYVLALGSEGAGLFGGLLFLAPTSSTLNVPLNRCTSLIAGTCATVALWLAGGGSTLGYVQRNGYELAGVVAMGVALAVGLSGGGKLRERELLDDEVAVTNPGGLVEATV